MCRGRRAAGGVEGVGSVTVAEVADLGPAGALRNTTGKACRVVQHACGCRRLSQIGNPAGKNFRIATLRIDSHTLVPNVPSLLATGAVRPPVVPNKGDANLFLCLIKGTRIFSCLHPLLRYPRRPCRVAPAAPPAAGLPRPRPQCPVPQGGRLR